MGDKNSEMTTTYVLRDLFVWGRTNNTELTSRDGLGVVPGSCILIRTPSVPAIASKLLSNPGMFIMELPWRGIILDPGMKTKVCPFRIPWDVASSMVLFFMISKL